MGQTACQSLALPPPLNSIGTGQGQPKGSMVRFGSVWFESGLSVVGCEVIMCDTGKLGEGDLWTVGMVPPCGREAKRTGGF